MGNVKGEFCPDTVLIPSLAYMSNAIELSVTYKIIRPHLFDILTKVTTGVTTLIKFFLCTVNNNLRRSLSFLANIVVLFCFQVVFPLLCPTDEDIELFQDEPRCPSKQQTSFIHPPVLLFITPHPLKYVLVLLLLFFITTQLLLPLNSAQLLLSAYNGIVHACMCWHLITTTPPYNRTYLIKHNDPIADWADASVPAAHLMIDM